MTTIDNQGANTFTNSLKNYLQKTERLDAIVGYFYFSGFQLIYKELNDKKIRILVGMNIDQEILKKVSVFKSLDFDGSLSEKSSKSRSGVLSEYIENFATIFNDTDEFDNEEAIEAFKLFLGKIQDGSLEIKKTPYPNHEKNYILHFKESSKKNGENPGIVITGSSNLSFSGLQGQREKNRVLMEKHYYEEDVKNFEKDWSNPDNIVITDIEVADYFIQEIKKKIWLYQTPSPLLLYYKVLDEYFSIEEIEGIKMPHEITGGKFTDLKYQRDAIEMGIDRINRFGGVIVADVVGLGKSIIASTIAHNLDMTAIIIAPPHLSTQWEDYRAEFDFKAFVYTTGKIEEALKRHGKSEQKLLLILDEAHKHRNEDTENYRLLHQLCAGNNVMALSATPFNNDPKDIYALVKLFTTPGRSTIKTVENLSMSFNELFIRYKKARRGLRDSKTTQQEQLVHKEMNAIALELRRMIEPLVIRRSRLDLNEIEDYKADLEEQGVNFAEMEPPKALEYDLGDLSDLYIGTLNKISPDSDVEQGSFFEGARYKPAFYLHKDSNVIDRLLEKAGDDDEKLENAKQKIQQITQAQVNVAKFMRRLLVRRFESSEEAFKISLNNMIKSAEQMRQWYKERKEVPIFKKGALPEVDDLADMSPEDAEEILGKLEGKGLILIPASEINADFLPALENDIKLLRAIEKEWEGKNDPKVDYFLQVIQTKLQENPKCKIVVFTEFADTANYVYQKVKEKSEIKVFKYTSSDANKENKQIIQSNFDAGLDDSEQEDEVDVLIATDAISEGFNLHRAGIIINYDIPYNPTRVIQRVGRINRINKKVFDKLYIYNFFPTFTGETETQTKTIAVFKKKIIDALLGDDTQIFTEDETLQNFFAKQYFEEKEKNEGKSWDAKYRNDWHKIRTNTDLMKQVNAIPHRVRIARKSSAKGVVVFAKKSDSFVFAYGKTPESTEVISPEEALPLFNGEISVEEKGYETSVNFDPVYQVVKKHIFKDNTVALTKTSKNRHDALGRIKILGQVFPPAREYAKDLEKIIKDLDGLPLSTLKMIAKMEIKKDPAKAYESLKSIVSQEYVNKLFSTAERAEGNGQLVLLSEELI